MFPPGRARLATKPLPTGSSSNAMTRGMVFVDSFTDRVTVGAAETMTSTLRRTSSAARSFKRSSFSSAYRHSMTMFFPSTYSSSRRPRRNASVRAEIVEGETPARNPIRGIFFGCCAWAVKHSARSMALRAKVVIVCFIGLPSPLALSQRARGLEKTHLKIGIRIRFLNLLPSASCLHWFLRLPCK